MYAHPQQKARHDAAALRRAGGAWLRERRKRRGLTCRALAARLGVAFGFVQQLEAGRGRVPPDRYEAWARALGMTPAGFVRGLMRFYGELCTLLPRRFSAYLCLKNGRN